MDRFIERGGGSAGTEVGNLKSNMDRFIAIRQLKFFQFRQI